MNLTSAAYFHNVGRNLISNPNGREELDHWIVKSNGGNGFAFENPPQGSDNVPVRAENNEVIQNNCFATSFGCCSKEQVIDLSAFGFSPDVIKQRKLKIYVKDWYAGRFDCGCFYECVFSLLDGDMQVKKEFKFRANIDQWEGKTWHKVEHIFKECPDNVRYIKFYHEGSDRQNWAGHYGAKMTGSSVIIRFD